MFILIFILLALLLESPKWIKDPHKAFAPADGYLSAGYTNQIRGFLAILIIYYHLALNGVGDGWFTCFANIGNYIVGVFFSLSGYGLMTQYRKRGQAYRKGFLWRRLVVSILIPFLVFNVLYYLWYALSGEPRTVLDMLRSCINGHPLVFASWYIIAIIFFYLVFWAALMLVFFVEQIHSRGTGRPSDIQPKQAADHENRPSADGKRFPESIDGRQRQQEACVSAKSQWFIVIFCFLGSLAWMVICHAMGYGDWWFYSHFPLNAGMVWALVHDRVEEWLKKIYESRPVIWNAGFWIIEAVLLGLCVLSYYAASILPKYIGMQSLIYLGGMQASAILLSLFVICLGMKVQFRGRCLAFLGQISMEIYLCHGLFLYGFRSSLLYVQNDLAYSLCVLAASVVAAFLLHRVFGWIKRLLLTLTS